MTKEEIKEVEQHSYLNNFMKKFFGDYLLVTSTKSKSKLKQRLFMMERK